MTTTIGDEPLIDAIELGRRLNMKAATMLLLARRKRIPSVRISRRIVRFRYSDVIRQLEKH